MPNTFAYVALLGWPIVAIYLFSTKRFEKAIIWSVVGSFLFLPSAFAIDFVGLPPLDKELVSNLTLLVLVLLFARERFQILPPYPLARILVLSMVAGAFLTSMNNLDPIWNGVRILPGLKTYDAVSSVGQQLTTIIPFLIGCQYLASAQAHRSILQILLIAGLVYSLLALFEVRMSPQLHIWTYGYFPHTFSQTVRGDGFRPVVFFVHGLWLAFFIFTATIAAAALWRDSKKPKAVDGEAPNYSNKRPHFLYATGYLFIVLILCKSLGSTLFAVFSIPILVLAKPKNHLRIAVILALVSVTYPLMRSADLVPTNTIVELAKLVSVQRAESLQTRIVNEDRLLAHAEERPILGWGPWGRNRVYDEATGKDISITDGYWIISIGTFGWIGYLSSIGLLALPIFATWRRVRKNRNEELPIVTSALCLFLGINLIELLPNATLPPWTWLIGGALLGYASRNDGVSTNAVENHDIGRSSQGINSSRSP